MNSIARTIAMAGSLMWGISIGRGVPPDGPQDISFQAKVDGTVQKYVEWLPSAFDAAATNDVLLAFHGHGSDRWQFIKDARGECRGVREIATRFKLILVSPDYRAATSWMGPKAETDVLQIINELKQRHKIGRVFLAGGSMGGTSVLTFAALHPELIAGVCSLNGTANLMEYDQFQDAISASFGGNKTQVPDEYRKRSAEFWPDHFVMPAAFTTGGRDELVPPQSVLRLAEKLKQAGRKILLIHRENGGHSTTYEDTCAALEFILRETAGSPSGALIMPAGLSVDDQQLVASETRRLERKLSGLRALLNPLREPAKADRFADADLFHKGVLWALRYQTNLSTNDAALLKKSLQRGLKRGHPLA